MKDTGSIFLTGGNGFIGKNILEQLGKKYVFYAPSSKELNLLDAAAVQKFMIANPIDIVIHGAKIGGTRNVINSAEIAELNSRMFFNIVRNKKYFRKMIFLGTGAEYCKSRSMKKIKEDDFDKKVPIDSFGYYKYVCSKYIESSDKIVNLRIFGVYGKYEDYELRFISNAICKNLLGLPITMRQNVNFDYVYIDDLIKIVDYFIQNTTKEKFYNIGQGESVSLLNIAKLINKISDQKSEIIIKQKGLNNEYTCDNSRLKKEIKNLEFSSLENTVRTLYLYYKSIKPSLRKEAFLVDK